MSWDRIKRQEETLREKIATIVVERLSDPRMGFVTVTRVELTRDRREAAVFYTVLGEDTQRRTTKRALDSAAPHIQERVGKTLKMRRTPILRFVYDDAIEKESRMLSLLDQVASEWDQPEDGDAEGGGTPSASDGDASTARDAGTGAPVDEQGDTDEAADADRRGSDEDRTQG